MVLNRSLIRFIASFLAMCLLVNTAPAAMTSQNSAGPFQSERQLVFSQQALQMRLPPYGELGESPKRLFFAQSARIARNLIHIAAVPPNTLIRVIGMPFRILKIELEKLVEKGQVDFAGREGLEQQWAWHIADGAQDGNDESPVDPIPAFQHFLEAFENDAPLGKYVQTLRPFYLTVDGRALLFGEIHGRSVNVPTNLPDGTRVEVLPVRIDPMNPAAGIYLHVESGESFTNYKIQHEQPLIAVLEPLQTEDILRWRKGEIELEPGREFKQRALAGLPDNAMLRLWAPAPLRPANLSIPMESLPEVLRRGITDVIACTFVDGRAGLSLGLFEPGDLARWRRGDVTVVPLALYAIPAGSHQAKLFRPFDYDLYHFRQGTYKTLRPDGNPWRYARVLLTRRKVVPDAKAANPHDISYIEFRHADFDIPLFRFSIPWFVADQHHLQNDEELIVWMTNDPNHGIEAIAFRPQDFQVEAPETSVNEICEWFIINGRWIPISAAEFDIIKASSGERGLHPVKNRGISVSVRPTERGGGEVNLNLVVDKKKFDANFHFTPSEMTNLNLNERPVWYQLAWHPQYGSYITLEVRSQSGPQRIGTTYFMEDRGKKGQNFRVEFPRLQMADYLYGRTGIDGHPIEPPEELWTSVSVNGELILTSRPSERCRFNIWPLRGQYGVLIREPDPAGGWRFKAYLAAEYNPKSPGEPLMIGVRDLENHSLIPSPDSPQTSKTRSKKILEPVEETPPSAAVEPQVFQPVPSTEPPAEPKPFRRIPRTQAQLDRILWGLAARISNPLLYNEFLERSGLIARTLAATQAGEGTPYHAQEALVQRLTEAMARSPHFKELARIHAAFPGAGTSAFLVTLARTAEHNEEAFQLLFRMTATEIDLSNGMLAAGARLFHSLVQGADVRQVQGNLTNLPLSAQSQDLIVIGFTLNQLRTPARKEQALSEVLRVTRHGGWMAFSEPRGTFNSSSLAAQQVGQQVILYPRPEDWADLVLIEKTNDDWTSENIARLFAARASPSQGSGTGLNPFDSTIVAGQDRKPETALGVFAAEIPEFKPEPFLVPTPGPEATPSPPAQAPLAEPAPIMFEAASPLAAQTISPKVSHRRAILIGLIVVGALVTLGLLLLWWHPWALVRKGEIRSGDSVERAILKKSS